MSSVRWIVALSALGASCAVNTPEPQLAAAPAPTRAPAPAPPVVPQPEPLPDPVVPHPEAYRGFPVSLPALVSPELGPYFERLAIKHDPKNWYVWREQTAPRGFRELRKAGKFPGGAFATVRAYEFGYDRSYPRPSVVDRNQEDCGVHALASNGTLCPSVIAPGVTLTESQATELFAIVNEVKPGSIAMVHNFNFGLGFVVFDAEDQPVAEISVDRAAVKIWSEPQQSLGRADILGPPRSERMQKLLAALGFPVPTPSLEQQLDRQRKLDGTRHQARYLPVASGVPTELRLDQTNDEQRDHLCTWKELLFRQGSPYRDESSGTGFICPDGVDTAATLPDACRSDFPRCSATVGEVEACLRHMRFDGCFKQAGSETCAKLRSCFWGMDFTLTPTQP